MGLLRKFSVCWLFLIASAFAQLSPGDLAEPHKDLEGISSCTNCHELGEGPSASKCLDCHRTIRTAIEERRGYHYQIVKVEGKICFSCHADHAGREFELIRWPEKMERFDHKQTGYILQGKHTEQKCRDCHHPGNLSTELKQQKDVNSIKTFMGLPTDCIGCHRDEHRGQLNKNCESCHNQNGWKKENKFDHDKTKFRLTGKHRQVDCVKCHPMVHDVNTPVAKDSTYMQFVNIKHTACTSCHKDVHKGKFGSDCQRCHVTEGWKILDERNVDHNKTNFPLLGKHVAVACDKCHKPGVRFGKNDYDACLDCHSDRHFGQFAKRPDQGKCESCHTVNGFMPSLFGVASHNTETAFILAEAHLAQPCQVCHALTEAVTGEQYRLFKNEARACQECHRDPHMSQFTNAEPSKTCNTCHNINTWKGIAFDHDKDSRYALQGAHKKVACIGCHKTEINGTESFVRYKPLKTACRDCHGVNEESLQSLDS